jgi:hypothetical protein
MILVSDKELREHNLLGDIEDIIALHREMGLQCEVSVYQASPDWLNSLIDGVVGLICCQRLADRTIRYKIIIANNLPPRSLQFDCAITAAGWVIEKSMADLTTLHGLDALRAPGYVLPVTRQRYQEVTDHTRQTLEKDYKLFGNRELLKDIEQLQA